MVNHPETPQLEHEVFDFVRKTEESVLDVGRQWAKAAERFVPFELPVVHDIVDGAFGIAAEVLKVQRDFAQSVVSTARSLVAERVA